MTKGVWQHSESETEVAVKILKCGSTEDERVKFLQEAAIMGQFKHPNIIKIHGVVTIAEPVRLSKKQFCFFTNAIHALKSTHFYCYS